MNHGMWCFQAYDMLIYFDCSKSGKFNGKPQCQCLVNLISMGWAPVILTASMDGVSTIKHCFLRNQVLEARWRGCHGMEIRSDTASKKKIHGEMMFETMELWVSKCCILLGGDEPSVTQFSC